MHYSLEKLKSYSQKVCDHGQLREYSVLLPIVQLNGVESILFQVRSHKLTKQPGEICFPGGRIEQKETPLQAAVRETCEELIIKEESIRVVSEIDTLVTPFNTVIYPFTAYLDDYRGTFSSNEVHEIFTVPLYFLVDYKPQCHFLDVQMLPREDFPFEKIQYGKEYPWARGKYPVYIYEYQDKVIWGITARILHNFIEIIQCT